MFPGDQGRTLSSIEIPSAMASFQAGKWDMVRKYRKYRFNDMHDARPEDRALFSCVSFWAEWSSIDQCSHHGEPQRENIIIELVEEEEEEGQEEGGVRGEKGIWLGDHGSAIAWLVSQLLGIWRWPYVPPMLLLLWPLGRWDDDWHAWLENIPKPCFHSSMMCLGKEILD